MNKILKQILIALGIVLICYISFVTVDCIRLKNSKRGTKPLITISEYETDSRTGYKGLGYTIEYYVDKEEQKEGDMTYINVYGYGAEFRLFDKIMVWAWIE